MLIGCVAVHGTTAGARASEQHCVIDTVVGYNWRGVINHVKYYWNLISKNEQKNS